MAVARPLQIQLDKVSVDIGGAEFLDKRYIVVVRLRCWPAGATVPTDPTFIDAEVDGEYITNGTVGESLTTWAIEVAKKCQRIIDIAILEDSLYENSLFDTKVTQIEGNLTG